MQNPVAFEWDDSKAASNKAKHGVSFEDAVGVFLDSRRIEGEDDRRNYGEPRLTTYGYVDGRCLSVVYTMRGETGRLISARPASRRERRSYDQARAQLEE